MNVLGTVLYGLRFIMSFFYIGLIVVLIAILYQFGLEVWNMVAYLVTGDVAKTDLMIKALELVDATMVAQLVWVVSLAGFSLFVANEHFQDGIRKPEWLDDVNTYNLKLKLSFAIISISGVYALKTYLQGNLPRIDMFWVVGIHVLFVVSAVGMAYAEYIAKKNHT